MATIKIRIGAERDRSVDTTFASIEKRAARSAVLIGKMLNKGFADGMKGSGAGGSRGPGGGAAGSAKAEERARIAAARREDNEKMRLFRQRQRLEHAGDLAAHRERMALLMQEQRAKLSAQRNAARAAQRESQRERRQFAERTSHRATRFLLPNAPVGSMAARALGDVARGAGVDFSVAGSVARAVSLEKAATDLSNSGYQAGQSGANGRRVDPRELIAQARGVGDKYGLNTSDALEGLAQFQRITGDLATGRGLLDDMAKLSAATGTNLADMAAAAANVSNGIGDIPNKAAVIDKVMRTIAGQGKLGAVEISDLATQMARVAAAAGQFTGDRAENIEKMGALAQIARATGGAPSAAEAARSVVGFANTLKKSARIGEFKNAGINVFADAGKTEFKDPIQLIKESLTATGGDLQKMNKLFMDVIGARGVAGLSRTYSRAGGGAAGLKAVDEELSRLLKGAALSQDEINESARRASETTAAKAARFQNQLDSIVEKTATKLIPALEKLAPQFLRLASALGDLATWAAENPMKAAFGAVAVSVARAGLESTFRTGIERLIAGSRFAPGGAIPGSGYNRNSGFGGGVGIAGNVTAAFGIVGAGIAAYQIGTMYVDQLIDESSKQRAKEIATDASNEQLTGKALEAYRAGDFEKALELMRAKVKQDEADVKATENQLDPSWFQSAFESIITADPLGLKGDRAKERAEAFAQRDAINQQLQAEQKAELEKSNRLLREMITAIQQSGSMGGGAIPGRQEPPVPGQ